MELDHFVIHVDNDAKILENLKKKIAPLGFPFDPEAEQQMQGFATANIWIGEQNLEIVRLLQPSVSGWNPRWVKCYNEGNRGIFSIFIAVKNLNEVREGLVERGVEIPAPEPQQTLAKASKDIIGAVTDFLGLKQSKSKKTSPWRSLNLSPIPATNMDISFLEYEEGLKKELKTVRKPNSAEYGITSIHRVKIYLPLWEEGIEYLQKVFPQLLEMKTQQKVEFRKHELIFFRSDPETGLKLKLEATAEDKKYAGNKFKIENVELRTTG